MPKYKVISGKINITDQGGIVATYRVGDVFESDKRTLGGLRSHCELIEGTEEAETIPVEIPKPTKIAYRRSDAMYDVVNVTTGAPLSEQPLTEQEAAAIADAFAAVNERWTDLEYEDLRPFCIQKVDGVTPGKPSFNVINRLTGTPINAEPITKREAQELLTEKLGG